VSEGTTGHPNDHVSVAVDAVPMAGTTTGVGLFVSSLVAELARRPDVSVRAYGVASRARSLRHLLPEGVAFTARDLPARLVNLAWRSGLRLPSAEALAGGAEVVHGTNYVVPPARRLATVVTVHDMTAWLYPELCAPPTLAYPALVARAAAAGAFVHTPSQFVAAELAAVTGLDVARIRVVPGAPAPAPRGDAGRPAVASSPCGGAPYVLALGTVEPRKDYPGLVAAFAQLAREMPDVWLVIAGKEAWGASDLDAAVTGSGVAKRIKRLGYVPEEAREALVRGAAVVAYPSVYEGFGMTPLEAMAAGIPVVASDAGALPEVLGDGALLVAQGDDAALATGLRAVLGDTQLRAELIGRGGSRAASFSWERTAAGMAALYREARDAQG
jgi:glycosyltransferase involved in cell wall biosynthesis